MVIVIVKFFLGLVTPLSLDFIDWLTIANGSLGAIPTVSLYAPWVLIMKAIVEMWLILPVTHPRLEDVIGVWYFRPSLSIILLIAMEKAPLLLFDTGVALTIRSVVNRYHGPAWGNRAMVLWLANPYVTLTTEMFGTWDIVSTFFLLISCVLFSRGQYLKSGLALSVGIAAKVYPILALPVFLLFLSRKNLRPKLTSFASGVTLPYVPMLIVLFQAEKTPLSSSLLAHYVFLNLRLLLGYTLILGGVPINLLVIAFSLFVFGYLFLWKPDASSIFEGVFCLFLIVFAFSHWEPQYLLHMLPFLTIFYMSSGRRKLPFIAYMAGAMVYVLLDWAFYFTSWGHTLFFIPNYNSLMEHYSQLYLFIPGWPIWADVTTNTVLIGPARSIFIAASLCYVVWVFLRRFDVNILRKRYTLR
jgi:hypothetical protein